MILVWLGLLWPRSPHLYLALELLEVLLEEVSELASMLVVGILLGPGLAGIQDPPT
jgi:hypothetical protein